MDIAKQVEKLKNRASIIERLEKELKFERKNLPPFEYLAGSICAKLGIDLEDLHKQDRHVEQTFPRMIIASELNACGCNVSNIARILKRDRKSVYNMIRKAEYYKDIPEFVELKKRLQ